MTAITKNGYYFVGKVKDLSRHLKLLSSQYPTLQKLINTKLQ